MNKIVNDKQCTIIWNVDDLKMSHFDPDIVSSFLSNIDAENGKIFENNHHAGKYTNTLE